MSLITVMLENAMARQPCEKVVKKNLSSFFFCITFLKDQLLCNLFAMANKRLSTPPFNLEHFFLLTKSDCVVWSRRFQLIVVGHRNVQVKKTPKCVADSTVCDWKWFCFSYKIANIHGLQLIEISQSHWVETGINVFCLNSIHTIDSKVWSRHRETIPKWKTRNEKHNNWTNDFALIKCIIGLNFRCD